jgi:hypothetical protein
MQSGRNARVCLEISPLPAAQQLAPSSSSLPGLRSNLQQVPVQRNDNSLLDLTTNTRHKTSSGRHRPCRDSCLQVDVEESTRPRILLPNPWRLRLAGGFCISALRGGRCGLIRIQAQDLLCFCPPFRGFLAPLEERNTQIATRVDIQIKNECKSYRPLDGFC